MVSVTAVSNHAAGLPDGLHHVRAEKGSREAGSYQNSLKSLHSLQSPGEGTAAHLLEGREGEPFTWGQPVLLSEEYTRVWTNTVFINGDRSMAADSVCWGFCLHICG